ncbi:MAG: hypothetical protein ACR2O0_11435 [Rhizobiaceae bacterium]
MTVQNALLARNGKLFVVVASDLSSQIHAFSKQPDNENNAGGGGL